MTDTSKQNYKIKSLAFGFTYTEVQQPIGYVPNVGPIFTLI
jgi:hypothetical protein